jgi:hypothetical protein
MSTRDVLALKGKDLEHMKRVFVAVATAAACALFVTACGDSSKTNETAPPAEETTPAPAEEPAPAPDAAPTEEAPAAPAEETAPAPEGEQPAEETPN